VKTSTTLLVILALVVGYLLSPPFVMIAVSPPLTAPLEEKDRQLESAVRAFYHPTQIFARWFPPYREVLKLEYRMLGYHLK
jgi:hypothetical protein